MKKKFAGLDRRRHSGVLLLLRGVRRHGRPGLVQQVPPRLCTRLLLHRRDQLVQLALRRLRRLLRPRIHEQSVRGAHQGRRRVGCVANSLLWSSYRQFVADLLLLLTEGYH